MRVKLLNRRGNTCSPRLLTLLYPKSFPTNLLGNFPVEGEGSLLRGSMFPIPPPSTIPVVCIFFPTAEAAGREFNYTMSCLCYTLL